MLFSVFITHAQVNKAPASKKPIEFKQPDGTILIIFLKVMRNYIGQKLKTAILYFQIRMVGTNMQDLIIIKTL